MVMRGKNETLVAVKRGGMVIRSLGENTRKARVVGRTHGRARMVATSRRKRMVAHNITDVHLLFAVMVRRRTFFQEDPAIVFLTLELFIVPPNKVEVEPCFVVAALISQADAKSFTRNGKCAMLTNFQCPSESGGLRNPQTSAQLPGIDPGPHNGEGPGGIGKAQSAKASSMVLMLFLLSHRTQASQHES